LNFGIQFVEFTLQGRVSKEFTNENLFWAHFRGTGIYEYRLKYQGADEEEATWKDWDDYDFTTVPFWGTNYNDGYEITIPFEEYGTYEVTLELRNPFVTQSYAGSIIYKPRSIEIPIYQYVLIGVGAFAVVGVIAWSVRKVKAGRAWRKYL
jgi:hypothetical protein